MSLLRSARLRVVLLAALLAYYVGYVGTRGLSLLGDDRLSLRGLGLGLLLLAVLGAALVAGEVRFGLATARLAREIGDVAVPPYADAAAAAEAAPEDWRAWYRLAVAYYAERDPRRARAAMRHAVHLHGASAR